MTTGMTVEMTKNGRVTMAKLTLEDGSYYRIRYLFTLGGWSATFFKSADTFIGHVIGMNISNIEARDAIADHMQAELFSRACV